MRIKNTTALLCQYTQGHSFPQRRTVANLASILLIGIGIFVSMFLSSLCGIVCLHSCEDLESAWQEEMQVLHDLFNYARV